MERLSPDETSRLEDQLSRSPIFSPEFQPQPEVIRDNREVSVLGWKNCCPEIAFDAYGVFAASGSHMDKDDRRLRERELKAKGVPSDDWRWGFGSLQPTHYSECSEYSVLCHAVLPSKHQTKRSDSRNISQKQRWEIFVRDNFTCHYCGRKPPVVALTVDHVIPVDAEGTKEASNLVTACEECNAGKSNKPPPKLS